MALEEVDWAEAPWAAGDLVAEVSAGGLQERHIAAEDVEISFNSFSCLRLACGIVCGHKTPQFINRRTAYCSIKAFVPEIFGCNKNSDAVSVARGDLGTLSEVVPSWLVSLAIVVKAPS